VLSRDSYEGLIATGGELARAGRGGGILTVVLHDSAAGAALARAAELALSGAAPLTVLVQVRRPPVHVLCPFCVVGPYVSDADLRDDALQTLGSPVRALGRCGPLQFEVESGPIERAAVRLLRERDYADVVVAAGGSRIQRRRCRRLAAAANAFCAVEVVWPVACVGRSGQLPPA
jgi:nucleotide-binding universal stress UspA family protein